MKRILALLLAVCLQLSFPADVAAQKPDVLAKEQLYEQAEAGYTADIAIPATLGYSAGRGIDGAALLELLEYDPGGTIVLDGDITLDSGADYIYLTSPVTVDAGPYTIAVDMSLSITGPITFTGTGTVVRVSGSGHLGTDSNGRIAARGDDSTALYLEQGGSFGLSTPVNADGSGATGIYAEGDREFIGATVTATGAGSTGIHTTGSAHLLLSFVQGSGEAVVSDIGDIILEGGGAQPTPEGATVIPLHGTHALSEENWFLPAGAPPDAVELWGETLALKFTTNDGSLYGHFYPVTWDVSRVNWDTPGGYPVTGELRLPFATDLMTWDPLEFTVAVLQSDRAQITHATLAGEDLLLLHLMEEIPGAWWVRVWCAADGGDSWRDLDEEGLVSAMPGGILQIEGLADEVTYRFYLEVWGGPLQGTSNTLEFYADPDDRQGGGEREGDKDGEDATLPPVTGPQPTDPPPENGGDPGTGGTATGGGTTRRGDGSEEEPADTTGPDDSVAADKPQGNPEPPASQQPDSGQSDPADRLIDVALPAIAAARTEAPGYPEGAQVWKRERLAMLARDNPEQVSFHAGMLRADLPTAPLLEVVGNGDFAVLLEQPGPDGFRIALYADGTELEGLGGAPFRVLAPAPDIGGMLNCLDEAGGKTAVELEGNQAIATLTRTGTYTLASNTSGILLLTAEEQESMPESESTNTAQGNTPALGWIAMTVAAAIAMGAAALLFIRWRCRRG